MPTQTKPTLFLNESYESQKALNVIRMGQFPHLVDLDPPSYINAPALVYDKKMIKGFTAIDRAVERYINTKDLHKVFFPKENDEDENQPKKKTKSKSLDSKKEMGYALIGYLLGGLWIITIDMFVELTPIVQAVLLLIIPVGILGWPYYYPYIKEQYIKSQQTKRKD